MKWVQAKNEVEHLLSGVKTCKQENEFEKLGAPWTKEMTEHLWVLDFYLDRVGCAQDLNVSGNSHIALVKVRSFKHGVTVLRCVK